MSANLVTKGAECLFGKTISVCTWLQHGFIAANAVWWLGMISPLLGLIVAVAVSVGFIYRELQGPDKGKLPWYKRLVNGVDRTGDWVVPVLVGFGTWYAMNGGALHA